MKNLKYVFILAAAALIAAISMGASGHDDSRPALVTEDQWIPLNDRAGFALFPETKNAPLSAELYVRTNKGWRRATLANTPAASLLSR